MAQPKFNRAQPVDALRDLEVFLYEDDGATPAPIDTPFTGRQAKRLLSGTTGVLTSVLLSYVDPGINGNTYSVAFVADGLGAGNVSAAGNDLTYHFQSGVTTVAQAQAQLLGFGILFSGTFVGSAVLTTPNDVFTARKLAGGVDAALFVRSGGVTWLSFEGTWTNTGIAGSWIYQYTIGELDFIGSQVSLRVTKGIDPAYLDLSTKTVRVDTIVEDKFASLDYTGTNPWGNATTLQFIADGAGVGSLDESAYPVIKFHYSSGVTKVGDFEDAVVASTKLRIKQYGKWTNLITAAGDTFAATNLINGRGYKQDIFPAPMEYGDFNSIGEGDKTFAQMARAIMSGVTCRVSDFRTDTLEFLSADGTKIRFRVTLDDSGRIDVEWVDLTP